LTRKSINTSFWCTAVFVCVVGLFMALEGTNAWDMIAVPHMPVMFADIIGVLAASDCLNAGIDVYKENPCDPWKRIHVLGSNVSFLGSIGLDKSDGYWLGWTGVLLFWTSALLVTRPSHPLQAGLILAALISPAIMLGAERANIDLFLFFLLTVTLWLSTRSSIATQVVAALVVLLAATIKLYPAAAGIGLLACYWKYPDRRWIWISALALFGLWMGVNISEVVTVTGVAPKPHGHYTFGGELLFRYLATGFSKGTGFSEATRLASIILFLLVSLLALILTVIFPLNAHRATEVQKISYVVGLSVLVFCFIATTNYDHRHIYFILLFPFLFYLMENKLEIGWRYLSWGATILMFFSLWREILPRYLSYYILEGVLGWLMLVPLISIGWAIIGMDTVVREQLKKRICNIQVDVQ